ncbi:MAG: MBG domain-containing protein, partial [Bacteroidota bacterium]
TLIYGDKIGNFSFTYEYDDSNVDLADQSVLLSSIEAEHQLNLASAIALIDKSVLVNGVPVTTADLQNLGFMVSERALLNARALVNGPAIVNTTYIVDVATQSVFNYIADPNNTTLASAGPLVNARALVNGPGVVNGSAIVNGRALVNGPGIINSSTVTNSEDELVIIIDEDDVNAPPGDTLADFKSITVVTGTTVGVHDVVPGALISNNFDITYGVGKLTITPATLTITADNKSRQYGSANPPLTIIYSGFQYADDVNSITPPTISTTATITSPVGGYAIELTGGSASNYILQLVNGTLTITQAPLTVKANNKVTFVTDPLPPYTVTYTGFKNGDQSTIISGPLFTVSGNPAVAGVYSITPSALVLPVPVNYTITYQPGILYVNPKGPGTQKVTVYLNCIDSIGVNGTGFTYLAHFGYTNPNSTAVFVPKGIDNSLSSFGGFSLNQPELFLPGTGNANIYFNGALLTWTVKTYENITKLTSSASANSLSVRCQTAARNSMLTENSDPALFTVYPNPVSDLLHIKVNTDDVTGMEVTVMDMLGKSSVPQITSDGNTVDLSMEQLPSGVYLVRLVLNNTWQVFQVIKQ